MEIYLSVRKWVHVHVHCNVYGRNNVMACRLPEKYHIPKIIEAILKSSVLFISVVFFFLTRPMDLTFHGLRAHAKHSNGGHKQT